MSYMSLFQEIHLNISVKNESKSTLGIFNYV
jgi:hypothetical protein